MDIVFVYVDCDWRLSTLMLNRFPIDIPEPFHLFDTGVGGNPKGWLFIEERVQDFTYFWGNVLWVLDFLVLNVIEDFSCVL